MNHRAAASAAILATACLIAAGCRAVTDSGGLFISAEPPLPLGEPAERRPSAAPRTLAVEVCFVRHDPRDPAFGEDLWCHVDEQALAPDLRLRLAANGLRAGIVTGPLPAEVAVRLEPAVTEDPVAPEAAGLRRLLRLLPGKRAEVLAATGLAELVLLERGAEGVRGATYRDATALVSVQAWPDADGRVRLRLVPEVKHGDIQRSWTGEEGMFRLETGQARHTFDDLGVTVRLPAGGMLLVGAADADGAAVGDALLNDRASSATTRLLVVRPLEAGADPLFATAGEDADPSALER